MKPGIHPEYTATKITCACGRVSETFSTVDELHVEICSHCHPFFTGRQKLVDTAGRVERFRRKYGSAVSEFDDEVEETVAVAEPPAEADADAETEPTLRNSPVASPRSLRPTNRSRHSSPIQPFWRIRDYFVPWLSSTPT